MESVVHPRVECRAPVSERSGTFRNIWGRHRRTGTWLAPPARNAVLRTHVSKPVFTQTTPETSCCVGWGCARPRERLAARRLSGMKIGLKRLQNFKCKNFIGFRQLVHCVAIGCSGVSVDPPCIFGCLGSS